MNVLMILVAVGLTSAVGAFANPDKASAEKSGERAKVEQSVSEQLQVGKEAAQAQKTVDGLDDAARALLDEYRNTLRKVENTKVYNQQLRDLMEAQKSEMVSLRQQIEQVKDTGKDVVPLMKRMLATLEQFVALDVPFLQEERTKRIAGLKEMMARADVSVSEKYRRILEAYQVENDYGRTIEAYRGVHKVNDKELTVDFLRAGRMTLVYQSLDGKKQGLWNQAGRKWQELDSEYSKSIKNGLKIARKQSAPDLLKLPVIAGGEVQK